MSHQFNMILADDYWRAIIQSITFLNSLKSVNDLSNPQIMQTIAQVLKYTPTFTKSSIPQNASIEGILMFSIELQNVIVDYIENHITSIRNSLQNAHNHLLNPTIQFSYNDWLKELINRLYQVRILGPCYQLWFQLNKTTQFNLTSEWIETIKQQFLTFNFNNPIAIAIGQPPNQISCVITSQKQLYNFVIYLKNDLHQTTQFATNQTQQFNQLNADLEMKQQELNDREKEITRLKCENEKHQKDINYLNDYYQEVNENLNQIIQFATQQINQLNADLEMKQQELNDRENEIKKLKMKINDLEKISKEKDKLRREIDEIKKKQSNTIKSAPKEVQPKEIKVKEIRKVIEVPLTTIYKGGYAEVKIGSVSFIIPITKGEKEEKEMRYELKDEKGEHITLFATIKYSKSEYSRQGNDLIGTFTYSKEHEGKQTVIPFIEEMAQLPQIILEDGSYRFEGFGFETEKGTKGDYILNINLE